MKAHILFLFLFVLNLAYSQQGDAYFQYHINVNAIDTSQQARQNASLLGNSTLKMYFSDNNMRVEYKMGKLYVSTIVLNRETGEALILMDGALGKFAVLKSADELEFTEVKKDSNAVIVDLKETKKILGYECRKIMLRSNDEIATYWITDEIPVNAVSNEMINPNLPGFPLEFSKVAEGLKMTYKASNISFEVENKTRLFSTVVPEGYQTMPNTTSR